MLAAMTVSLPWTQFQHPSVRDLAWLLLSPPLFQGQLGAFPAYRLPHEQYECIEWLSSIDQTLQQDADAYPAIARHSFRRLGLYCEALLTFYFEHCDHYPQVYHNVRLQGEQRTLGECDFLLADQQGRVSHVELAVKFYLQHTAGHSEWDAWIGPNAMDRLDLKLQRMITHQLALPQHHDAQAPLQQQRDALGLTGEITSLHLIKGILFFPHEAQQHWPEYGNTDGLYGTWMRISDFLAWASTQHCRVTLCEKMWLSGPDSDTPSSTLDEVIAKIRAFYERCEKEGKRLPGMLLRFPDHNIPLMVVDDHWPETRLPSRKI